VGIKNIYQTNPGTAIAWDIKIPQSAPPRQVSTSASD